MANVIKYSKTEGARVVGVYNGSSLSNRYEVTVNTYGGGTGVGGTDFTLDSHGCVTKGTDGSAFTLDSHGCITKIGSTEFSITETGCTETVDLT